MTFKILPAQERGPSGVRSIRTRGIRIDSHEKRIQKWSKAQR